MKIYDRYNIEVFDTGEITRLVQDYNEYHDYLITHIYNENGEEINLMLDYDDLPYNCKSILYISKSINVGNKKRQIEEKCLGMFKTEQKGELIFEKIIEAMIKKQKNILLDNIERKKDG